MDTLEQQFTEYNRLNPDVYEMFERFTFEAINSGATTIPTNLVFGRMRWETKVILRKPRGYKLPTEFKELYASMFMNKNPAYNGIFETM